MPSAVILHNPSSGRVNALHMVREAEENLRAFGWKAEAVESQSAEHFTALCRLAVEEGVEVLFVAGGDGSLHLAIQALAGTQTALATLPVGTANVWAQECGFIPTGTFTLKNLNALMDRLVRGKITSIDLGRCNQEYFLTWCGLGLDALAIRKMEPRPRWAKKVTVPHFAANVLWQVPGWRGMDVEIALDGETFTEHCVQLLASNISLYVGGLGRLAEDVRLDDGILDLWLFTGTRPYQCVEYAFKVMWNEHHKMPGLRRHRFQEIVIKASPLHVQMDGDPILQENPLHISVVPRALHVLMPS